MFTANKFPFPIPIDAIEKEKEAEQKEWQEKRRKQILSGSVAYLKQVLRCKQGYNHDYETVAYSFITEQEVRAELRTRPHRITSRNERKEFVKKQQKRTERKTKGAR